MELIPVTILTGFLGAGKTTLLQRVLTESHGQKIAVIENEFGEESIDKDLLVTETKEQIVQLNNGCICCNIREDLREALVMLVDKRWKGEIDFERVIIETTGMADPGPVAQTFFIDEEVANCYMLDSIITLVDAKHGNQTLNERVEAQRQVGFADQIFISKADLVSSAELGDLQRRLQQMNPRASQRIVHFGEVPLSDVLDLRGFNLNAQLDLDPDFLDDAHQEHGDHCCSEEGCCCEHDHDDACSCGHDHHEDKHCCGHENHHHHHDDTCSCGHEHHAHHHQYDDDVKSFVFRSTRPFNPAKLEQFLAEILEIYGPQMYRYKGVLYMQDMDKQDMENKVVFQGVHQVMGSDLGPKWAPGESRETKMVFIGINLPKEILLQGLEQSLE